MFPAIEPGVIGLILESCGGSQDRAIEQLLSMTDPEYKPDESSLGHEEAVGFGFAPCHVQVLNAHV